MKTLKLRKANLDLFAAVLQQFGEVHAPVRKGGALVFERLERWSDAEVKYTRTLLPPKKYFLPPSEKMFTWSAQGYAPVVEDPDQRIVLFGVHACDLNGLNILDEVFSDGVFPDPYYRARRQNVALIGIDCVPDAACYCRSMHADYVDKGFDLFLYEISDEDFMVHVGTALGDDMVLAAQSLFEPVTRGNIRDYKERSQELQVLKQLDVEIRDLPEILELEWDNDIWEELGEKCLACGACTMVCPTCYCYDVVDENALGCNAGTRCRNWDSCMFATHALVAGGENFRATQGARVRYRFYHKQRGFVAEYGHPSCIGCGRCADICPVGIKDAAVINRLRGVVSYAGH